MPGVADMAAVCTRGKLTGVLTSWDVLEQWLEQQMQSLPAATCLL